MRESLFYSALRSFFVALFAMVGILVGFILVILMFASIGDTTTASSLDIDTTYTPEIVANADGERKKLGSEAPVILKVNIQGVIGLDSLTKESVAQQLVESREGNLKDHKIKGVLLHINSPGGTVSDSDG